MSRLVITAAILLAFAAAGFWLVDEDARRAGPAPAASPVPEPSGPLARGVERSRAVITIRQGERRYELRGGLDLADGYRFRGRITDAWDDYPERGTPIWLANDEWVTLTRPSYPNRERVWLDDHPPTLPLARDSFLGEGAEVYAHMAILALKNGEFGREYDFARPFRRSRGYDELRRAGLAAARRPIATEVGAAGRLARLHIDFSPALVDVQLFPSERAIQPLDLRRFAME